MGIKFTIFLGILCGLFIALEAVVIVAGIVMKEPGFIVVTTFGAIIITAMMAAVVGSARDLRDHAPAATRDELLASIPSDAVDRRWVKEIENAFNSYYPNSLWSDADALMQEKHNAEQSASRQRVYGLISAAKNAGGVRLPPQVTAKD